MGKHKHSFSHFCYVIFFLINLFALSLYNAFIRLINNLVEFSLLSSFLFLGFVPFFVCIFELFGCHKTEEHIGNVVTMKYFSFEVFYFFTFFIELKGRIFIALSIELQATLK